VLSEEFVLGVLGAGAAGVAAAEQGSELVGSLEAAHAAAIDIVPEQVKPRLPPGRFAAVSDPATDMTDPALAPAATLRDKVRQVDVIPALVEKAVRSLVALRSVAEPGRWAEADTELKLHRATLLFERARTRLYEAESRGAARAEVRAVLREARGHFGEVLTWARHTMRERSDRLGFRLILEGVWGLRLARISRSHAATPVGRGLSWCLTVARLGLLYFRARRAQ
jgi:hypothetical protein